MAELRTEEEQVEALKSWWKENGKSTLAGIALAIVVVVGWRGWQANQQAAAEAASVTYQNMLQAALVSASTGNSEELTKSATHHANTLKQDFSDSGYAHYAALWLAKQAVETGDLASAAAELNWVLSQEPEPSVAAVSRLRLARVLASQGEHQQALNTLDQIQLPTFTSSVNEVKGDVYLAMGQVDQARDAYQAAVSGLAGPSERPILKMKLDDLAQAGDR